MKNAQTVIMAPAKTEQGCEGARPPGRQGRVSRNLAGDTGRRRGRWKPAPPADVRGSDGSQVITEDGRWAGRVPTRDSFAVVRYSRGKGDGVWGLQALYFCRTEFSPG